jgi:Ribonuclease H2 non-catalytic subunit (Ylr154p-like)
MISYSVPCTVVLVPPKANDKTIFHFRFFHVRFFVTTMTTKSNHHPEQNTSTSFGSTNSTTCHAVPCHIAYTGPANGIDIYFNPMDIPSTSATPSNAVVPTTIDPTLTNDIKPADDTNKEFHYQAAMIRGRGLLALRNVDDEHKHKYGGHVFQVVTKNTNHHEQQYNHSNNTTGAADTYTSSIDGTISESSIQQQLKQQQYLQSIQTFDQYVQWYHEHQPSTISTTTLYKNTRLDRAIEWMNTADCLHTPLPIIEKQTENN